jgi:hypothetical protein
MASQEENLVMNYPNCEKKWFDWPVHMNVFQKKDWRPMKSYKISHHPKRSFRWPPWFWLCINHVNELGLQKEFIYCICFVCAINITIACLGNTPFTLVSFHVELSHLILGLCVFKLQKNWALCSSWYWSLLLSSTGQIGTTISKCMFLAIMVIVLAFFFKWASNEPFCPNVWS